VGKAYTASPQTYHKTPIMTSLALSLRVTLENIYTRMYLLFLQNIPFVW